MGSISARRRSRRLAAAAALAAVLALWSLAWPQRAAASAEQVSIFQDGSVLGNPYQVQELRHLGVRVIRVFIRWSSFAPDPSSRRRPRFDAADPASYPAGVWDAYDQLDRAAADDDVGLLFTITGGAPQWATGPGAPPVVAHSNNLYAWRPSVRQFGQFVHAVGERYGGGYRPCRLCSPLPAVRYWEIYNEANFGEDLGPQAIDGSRVLTAPTIYRGIVAASWGALSATGHRHDTILLSGLAARGMDGRPRRGAPQGYPGNFGETKPLEFIRALYCVDSRYREYRGAAARTRGCPATRAAARRFRARNPGLFDASGFAIHPYPLGSDSDMPPNRTASPDPNYAALSQLPHMATLLDRVFRLYGSRAQLPIWNTEYGYLSYPPVKGGVSPATQALYLNWAEYLSWRNPRIRSFSQYLLTDPNPTVGVPEFGGFASGLLFFGGRPKPSYDAWRLPIFLPRTSAHAGQRLWVWGCVRPAYYAIVDTGAPQQAYIQFRASGGSAWTTLRTLTFTRSSCYFYVPVSLPSSGMVRLAYFYPAADPRLHPTILNTYIDPLAPAVSRSVAVTIH